MHQATAQLLQRYYDAFNAGDMVTFLSLLTDDVIHDINQSGREMGKPAFEQVHAAHEPQLPGENCGSFDHHERSG